MMKYRLLQLYCKKGSFSQVLHTKLSPHLIEIQECKNGIFTKSDLELSFQGLGAATVPLLVYSSSCHISNFCDFFNEICQFQKRHITGRLLCSHACFELLPQERGCHILLFPE